MKKIKISIEDLSNFKLEGDNQKSYSGGANRTKRKGDIGTNEVMAGSGCCDTANSGSGKIEWNSCDPLSIDNEGLNDRDYYLSKATSPEDVDYINSIIL